MQVPLSDNLVPTQVNMQIDPRGVTLASYAPRNLLKGRPKAHIAKLRGRTYLEEAMQAPKKSRRAKEATPAVPAPVVVPGVEEGGASAEDLRAVQLYKQLREVQSLQAWLHRIHSALR